jgi:ABC-type polysaccharide/polyol phosphate export permease
MTEFDSKVHESFVRYTVKNLRDVYLYRFALFNFVRNNLRMRYRRSTLGFIWSLLNPLLLMTVISIVFSLIFKQDIRVYSIYIFSGLAPWTFINQTIQSGGQSLVLSEGYLKKVYLPKLLFPVITVTTETVNFLFSLASLYILAIILGSAISWRILLLPAAIVLTYFFVLGIVIMISVATVYFRDLTQILVVIFTALFYLIPILYPFETIPAEFRKYFLLNPFYYYIMLFRKVIYGQQSMLLADWLIPIGISLVVMLLGLFVLMRRDRDIIYRL